MLGALATGLLSGGSSLLSGFGAASAQRKRDKANVEAVAIANYTNAARVQQMNAQLRARADKAAKVPVVTTTRYGKQSSSFDRSGVDMAGFLEFARKSGINPISVVRSGSLGAFATNVHKEWTGGADVETTTGERAMDAALAGSAIYYDTPNVLTGAPPQNTMSIVGGAAKDGLSAYSTIAQQDANNAFQLEYLGAQTAAQRSLQQDRRASYGSLAGGYTGGGVRAGGGTMGTMGSSGARGPRLDIGAGLDIRVNPDREARSPLEAFEKDYGGEVPDAIGVGRFIRDYIWSPELRDQLDYFNINRNPAAIVHERRTVNVPGVHDVTTPKTGRLPRTW